MPKRRTTPKRSAKPATRKMTIADFLKKPEIRWDEIERLYSNESRLRNGSLVECEAKIKLGQYMVERECLGKFVRKGVVEVYQVGVGLGFEKLPRPIIVNADNIVKVEIR